MSVDRDNLKAFLDGELTPHEMAEMQEALDRDPDLAKEAAQLRALSVAVSTLEPQVSVQGLEDTLRALQRSRPPSIWVRAWPLLAAMGALGAIAFATKLVQGPSGQADEVAFSREKAEVATSVRGVPVAPMELMEGSAAAAGAASSQPAENAKQIKESVAKQAEVRSSRPTHKNVETDVSGAQTKRRVPGVVAASPRSQPAADQSRPGVIAADESQIGSRLALKEEAAEGLPALVVEVDSPEEAEALIRGYAQQISAKVVDEPALRDAPTIPTPGSQTAREKSERLDRSLVLELDPAQVAEVRNRIPQLLTEANSLQRMRHVRSEADNLRFDSRGQGGGVGGSGGPGGQGQAGGLGGSSVGGGNAQNAQSANTQALNNQALNNQAANQRGGANQAGQNAPVPTADGANLATAGAMKSPAKRGAAASKQRLEIRIRAKAKPDR